MFEKITTLILPVAITFIGLGLLYMVFQSRLKHLETKLDTLCTVVNDEVSQRQQLIERFQAPQAPQVGAGSDVPAHPVAMDVTEGQVAGDAEEGESDSESEGSDYDSDDDTDADSDDGLDADVAEEGNAKLVYESDADAEMIDVSDDEGAGADVGVVEVLEAVAAAAEPMTHVTVEEVDLDSVEDSVGVIDVSLPAEAEAEAETDVKADVVADVATEPAEAAELPEPQPASPQEFDAAVGQEREASRAAVEEGADDATEYHEPEKHDIETMTEKEMRKLPVAYMRQYMVARNYTTAAEAKAMRKPEVVNFLMSKRE